MYINIIFGVDFQRSLKKNIQEEKLLAFYFYLIDGILKRYIIYSKTKGTCNWSFGKLNEKQ